MSFRTAFKWYFFSRGLNAFDVWRLEALSDWFCVFGFIHSENSQGWAKQISVHFDRGWYGVLVPSCYQIDTVQDRYQDAPEQLVQIFQELLVVLV